MLIEETNDAYLQWLAWEQQANHPKFRKDSTIQITIGSVLMRDIVFDSLSDHPLQPFGDKVFWLRHPFTTDPPFVKLTTPFSTWSEEHADSFL